MSWNDQSLLRRFAPRNDSGGHCEAEGRGSLKFASLLFVPLFFIAVASNPPVVLLAFSGTFALSAPVLWIFRKLFRRRRETGEA